MCDQHARIYRPTRGWHVVAVLLASIFSTSAVEAQVDFRTPERCYVAWNDGRILVEQELLNDAPGVAEKAAQRLQENINLAISILPKNARPVLERIPFYLMYGPSASGGGLTGRLEYFQKSAPRFRSDIDPNWQSCIVVYCAENYTQLSDFWALKAVVHELSHAWHLEQWPEDHPDILSAWQNSSQAGLHRNVQADHGYRLDASYASTNQLEYFAELSCMYFVGCDYQPFHRDELKSYDPVGFAMIERVWSAASETNPDVAPSGRTIAANSLNKPEARTWFDSEGRRAMTGQFKSYRKGFVTVQTSEQTEICVPLNDLSADDQAFVLSCLGLR